MKLYLSPTGNDEASGNPDSPMRTLQAAVNRISRNRDGFWEEDDTIYMHGGVYKTRETIDITCSAPLRITACPGETPVIDTGRKITGLQEICLNGLRCWTAEIEDVKYGNWYFHSLFTQKRRCTRAYLPRNDFYWMESTPQKPGTPDFVTNKSLLSGEDSFYAKPGDLDRIRDFRDAEIHVFHFWTDEHMPVKDYDRDSRLMKCTHRSALVLRDDYQDRYPKYRIENIFEGLCEPGDFYLSRCDGKLYYIPFPEENLENTELIAPTVNECVINIHDISDFRLEGIEIRHADWKLSGSMGKAYEYLEKPGVLYASSPQAACHMTGAVRLINVRRCSIQKCAISHVGGYAIDMVYDCSSVTVSGNRLTDLGAGGIRLNGANNQEPAQQQSHHIRIADNEITAGGRVFLSGTGILSMNAHHVDILRNHIYDLFYTGISCGWAWGYGQSVSHHNRILENHIHRIGQNILSDMGGIYTLSEQPGTVIRGNRVHDVSAPNYGGWGIYLDEGSSHIIVEDNITYNTSAACFDQHYGRENIIRNNIWAFGGCGIISYSRAEDHTGFTFEHNIVLTRGEPVYFDNGIGNIRADMNLFWDIDGKEIVFTTARDHDPEKYETLSQLRKRGYDFFSRVDDPCFADAENGDFTLAAASPAYLIGFHVIGARNQNRQDQ